MPKSPLVLSGVRGSTCTSTEILVYKVPSSSTLLSYPYWFPNVPNQTPVSRAEVNGRTTRSEPEAGSFAASIVPSHAMGLLLNPRPYHVIQEATLALLAKELV